MMVNDRKRQSIIPVVTFKNYISEENTSFSFLKDHKIVKINSGIEFIIFYLHLDTLDI